MYSPERGFIFNFLGFYIEIINKRKRNILFHTQRKHNMGGDAIFSGANGIRKNQHGDETV